MYRRDNRYKSIYGWVDVLYFSGGIGDKKKYIYIYIYIYIKVKGLFIRHILNYTGYNTEVKCKSGQVRSVDSAKKLKLNKSNTTQEHIY